MKTLPLATFAVLANLCLLLGGCGAKSPLRVPGAVRQEGADIRLLAPWSTSVSQTQSPRFSWDRQGHEGDAKLQFCADRECRRELASMITNESSASPPAPLPHGPVFWRVITNAGASSNTWEVFISRSGRMVDAMYGSVLDVNGDGLADVAAGGVVATVNGEANAGIVRVYHGRSDPPASGLLATATLTGRAGDQLGHAVASAGDVNGDGYGDLMVASVDADRPASNGMPAISKAGRVQVYFGSRTGISETPAWTHYGSTPNEAFGASVAYAGDVNRDGYSDVVIGIRLADGVAMDAGAAQLFMGSPRGLQNEPRRSVSGQDAMEFFGLSVAMGGDVNRDGLPDLVVGGLFAMPGGMRQAGRATLYLSPLDLPVLNSSQVLQGDNAFDAFATSLAPLFDYNGDGFADLLVGARYADPGGVEDAGSVLFYPGSANGVLMNQRTVIPGDQPGALFGHAIVRAGDLDGDGVTELAISAENGSHNGVEHGGYVQLYYRGEFVAQVGDRRGGRALRDVFGGALAGGADFDGDGYDDLVIGAYRAEVGALMDAGEVYLFRGGPEGIGANPSVTLSGDSMGQTLGYSLAL